MAEQKQLIFRPFHWIGLVVVAGVFLALFVGRKPIAPRRVTMVADSSGILRLHGMSLANTNVRDAIFKTMGAIGLKAEFTFTLTNGTQLRKMLDAMNAMKRAGLEDTNYRPSLRMILPPIPM